MNKIRILHILLSIEIGGMEQVVLNLARTINRTKYEPLVACLNEGSDLKSEFDALGIKVIKVDKMIPRWSFLYPKALTRVIRENSIDIVHTHSGCWHKAAWAARLAGGKAVVYTEHGRLVPESQSVVWLDRLFSPITTRVIAVSEILREYLVEQVKINRTKIQVIYNGVPDLSVLPVHNETNNPLRTLINNGTPIIGAIGRLTPVKDYSSMLIAMQSVVQDVPEAKLVLIGDGVERGKLENQIHELGLGNSVYLLGSRRDIETLLPAFTIFAISSLSEGTSMTILEAMAASKPVVATDVGGNKYIVKDGETGILVPPQQPSKFAQALIRLLNSQEETKKMGNAGRKRFLELFTVERMTQQYEQLYDELIAGH